MHAGTSQPTVTPAREQRMSRYLLIAAVLATSILAGCASRTSHAPVTDLTSAANSNSVATGGTYIVKPGDTLYKIAQQNNVDVATLIHANHISDPSQLRVGQTLRLGGSGGSAPALSSTPVATPVPVAPPAAAETTSTEKANDAGLIQWGWPASGRIIQGFNSNTKGIDISGAPGEPVRAAADGKVMYAGNGVRGLGNLILLGHSNGFITAYAHNQTLLVKTGQQVHRGAKIALIGQTDTTSPRLHFEIRRRGTPVNPLSYLPAR
ncbi:MAG: LysM peptidoglycan-binding domain-containing protein [Candidimonas sp.]|nr:MAG: LysM peptidoglycan-binding domain-containing protein [Candidimonas sp.]TAM20747.1 MAG: LysM peptidoglycan-binding domain-containing protein [Candidimonas sp.]TAM78101.1 MAG: LysM peptidoglycan-binding domain-containing protein [Candidimonas sp.]